jgi:hypothetical protein
MKRGYGAAWVTTSGWATLRRTKGGYRIGREATVWRGR